MPRNRRSSSSDSISSEERSSKYRQQRRHRSSSNSSSDSRSKRSRNKKSNKRNRRYRSDSSSSSRSSDKHSKHSKRNRRRSSSSPETKSRLIDLNMEREKNYEFNDGLNDLYKNEQSRRNQISKIEDDGGGFKPKSFKSSRSSQKTIDNKPKLSKEQEHDNAIFGTVASKSEASSVANPIIEFNVVSSNVKSLMHESLFEETSTKEKRWKLKLLELIKSN